MTKQKIAAIFAILAVSAGATVVPTESTRFFLTPQSGNHIRLDIHRPLSGGWVLGANVVQGLWVGQSAEVVFVASTKRGFNLQKPEKIIPAEPDLTGVNRGIVLFGNPKTVNSALIVQVDGPEPFELTIHCTDGDLTVPVTTGVVVKNGGTTSLSAHGFWVLPLYASAQQAPSLPAGAGILRGEEYEVPAARLADALKGTPVMKLTSVNLERPTTVVARIHLGTTGEIIKLSIVPSVPGLQDLLAEFKFDPVVVSGKPARVFSRVPLIIMPDGAVTTVLSH